MGLDDVRSPRLERDHTALTWHPPPRAARGHAWGWLALLLLAAAPVRAHDLSYAHAEVHWRANRVDVELTVHPDDAAMALNVPMPEWFLDAAFLARAGPALADSLRRRFELRADGQGLAWRYVAAHRDPRRRGVTLTLVAPLAHPPASLEVVGPVFPFVANHETFVSVFANDRLVQQDVLTAEHRVTRVYASGASGALAVLRTFIPAGIHHIAIGPDHILFVLGLLLLGGGLARLLKIVTAFTAAHSLTLALAALGLVHVPSRVVEPLIALSIVFVAVETLRSRGGTADMRAPLAFGFGLVHGFGFASVLAEFGLPREALGWSLLGFNVGVELGQAAIVLAVAPLLGWLASKQPAVHARVIQMFALGIAAAGGFWFVQRVLIRS